MNNKKIALALSGGGVRAMAYHAGVLKYLAERDGLERVGAISTVSGGSLLIGLIYSLNDYKWPSSEKYLTDIYPTILKTLTTKNLFLRFLIRLIFPWNWRYAISRSNVIALSITSDWGVTGKLSQIPRYPEWSINGTTFEHAVRFRFKSENIGDYKLGYAPPEGMSLSLAMAASAGFPIGIGPVVLKSKKYKWMWKPFGAPNGTEKNSLPKFKKIHIYDGGVYDNLGLEPFFDNGNQKLKSSLFKDDNSTYSLLVSDARLPIKDGFTPRPFHPKTALKVIDVAMNQARSLRVRSLMNFLTDRQGKGVYLLIGDTYKISVEKYGEKIGEIRNNHLSVQQAKDASNYKTSLSKMKNEDFELIMRNGYESLQGAYIARKI